MQSTEHGVDAFIRDITPFFYGKRLTYVDIGAYRGEVLQRMLDSGLGIREAHLIEPNPKSLGQAKQKLSSFKGNSIDFYNLAMSDKPGRVRLHAAKTMTRVVGTVADDSPPALADEGIFDIESTTLDLLAASITDQKISLLKIDAEGSETRVLEGASGLLSQQKIDCIYVEAGFRPDSQQQCYYRDIDDILQRHGYRVFRIYEQQNEWIDDSPYLRRINLAYFSQRFAENNPQQLTRQLYEARSERSKFKDELEQANTELTALRASKAATDAQLEEMNRKAEQRVEESRRIAATHESEKKALREQLARLQDDASAAAKRLAAAEAAAVEARRHYEERSAGQVDKLRAELDKAQKSLKTQSAGWAAERSQLSQALSEADATRRQGEQAGVRIQDAIPMLLESESEALKQAAKLQRKLERTRGKLPFRLARATYHDLKSPQRWLRLPVDLWRELNTTLPDAAVRIPSPVTVMTSGQWSTVMPLAGGARQLVTQSNRKSKQLFAGAVSVHGPVAVTLKVEVRATPEMPEGLSHVIAIGGMPVDATQRRPDVIRATVPLRPDEVTELLAFDAALISVVCTIEPQKPESCVLVIGRNEKSVPTSRMLGGALAADAVGAEGGKPGSVGVPMGIAVNGMTAKDIEGKLWGGFAAHALPEMERLKADPGADKRERETAAWYLGRWYYVAGDHESVLSNVEDARLLNSKPQSRFLLMHAQSLIELEHLDDAEAVLGKGTRALKKPDFALLQSTVVRLKGLRDHGDERRASVDQMAAINDVLRQGRLAPIELFDASQPLSMGNLVARPPAHGQREALKVSVVMATYNASGTIRWVLRGLLQQTWRNLEVIVVDDVSTDDTAEIVAGIAATDSRVRLLRNVQNVGAYRSRNAGAREATGDLITVHDSDDWSHPQKLERQIAALTSTPGAKAVVSHWVRMTEDLQVVGSWIPKGTIYDVNFSSLLFPRALLAEVGYWDDVLVSADAEFYSRLQTLFGKEAIVKMDTPDLLAFSLTRPNSLTRSSATHLRTLFYGLRRNYRDAYANWHATLTKEKLPFVSAPDKRPFPVPIGNRTDRLPEHHYDLVVISDLAMRGGAFVSTLNYIVAAARSGMKVAVFHWRKYSLSTSTPLQPRLYEAVMAHGIDIISATDEVHCDTLLFGYPAILSHPPTPLPAIKPTHVMVIVNQFASRLVDGGDAQYDPAQAAAFLNQAFGQQGLWIPISAWVRRLMQADTRYPSCHDTPWSPMIDTEAWCGSPIRWRGQARTTPVVGRHGRDAYTKWPETRAAVAAAYGVDQPWEVRFLGGAEHAITMLGEQPANWQVVEFDGMTAQEFLADLDFYIHYPHERYIEEFGRAVMEAMAVGIPVVLAPQFRETFGEAAVYATADEVAATINGLWANQDAYLNLARAGRAFVLRHCDQRDFAARLRQTLQGAAELLADATAARPDSSAPSHQATAAQT